MAEHHHWPPLINTEEHGSKARNEAQHARLATPDPNCCSRTKRMQKKQQNNPSTAHQATRVTTQPENRNVTPGRLRTTATRTSKRDSESGDKTSRSSLNEWASMYRGRTLHPNPTNNQSSTIALSRSLRIKPGAGNQTVLKPELAEPVIELDGTNGTGSGKT
jgi:hypothetical protein